MVMSAALVITFVTVAALDLEVPWEGATQVRQYHEVLPECAPTGLIIALHGAGGDSMWLRRL